MAESLKDKVSQQLKDLEAQKANVVQQSSELSKAKTELDNERKQVTEKVKKEMKIEFDLNQNYEAKLRELERKEKELDQ